MGRLQKAVRSSRDELVVSHLALVDAIAGRIAKRLPQSFDLDDLVASGRLGLLDAASRFNASLGVPFEAYARQRIHGAIADAYFKRRRYRDNLGHEELEDVHAVAADLDSRVERHERAGLVAIALSRLPDRERALVRARYAGNRTFAEIGAEIGVGYSRASQLHFRALRLMRVELERLGIRGT